VKSLYQHHIEKDDQYQALYLAKQYLMDYHIHTYKKPVIVYVDGIVYGGGVGLATAAKYMILSENAQMAMPETKIGFFPDVGTSRLLNDLPNQVGRYLGLLGVAMNTSDIIDLKITKYMISHDTWKFIEDKLKTLTLNKDDINERLEKLFLEHVGKLNHHSDFMKHMNQIKCIFSKKDINEMLLEIDKNDFFELKILDRLNEMSPTALFVTHKLLQKTQKMTLYECFKFEHSLSKNIIKTHDFKEGVRSLLIDKDKRFDYQPQEINKVIISQINKEDVSFREISACRVIATHRDICMNILIYMIV